MGKILEQNLPKRRYTHENMRHPSSRKCKLKLQPDSVPYLLLKFKGLIDRRVQRQASVPHISAPLGNRRKHTADTRNTNGF